MNDPFDEKKAVEEQQRAKMSTGAKVGAGCGCAVVLVGVVVLFLFSTAQFASILAS